MRTRALLAALGMIAIGCSAAAPGERIVEVTAPAPSAPEQRCTQMGCFSGLLIEIDAPATVGLEVEVLAERKNYILEVEADGKKASCAIDLPSSGEMDGSCTGDVLVFIEPYKEFFRSVERGYHILGIESLALPSPPTELRLRLLRDGEVVAELSARPEYHVLQPNGPGCEPTCRVGVPLRLTLPHSLVGKPPP